MSAEAPVSKDINKTHNFQSANYNQTAKPPQAWLVVNIISTILAFIFLMLTILVKFTSISHTSPIFTILSVIITAFLKLFASVADLVSPGIAIITVLIILIMNPICAIGYLIENRRQKLPFTTKNLIFATLPLLLSILIIIIS